MAERRMFSKSIISSARFLRMPQTSRLLYYDLGMNADDDGVVEAFTVLRTTGAAEDDLRILATKGFVSVLNEDLVSFVTDWKVNNMIRKDRYKPSLYSELLVKLEDGSLPSTIGLPDGNQRETQIRLGKDSPDKESVCCESTKKRSKFKPPTVLDVEKYASEESLAINAERFVDFYSSKGWKVGSSPMKDWKAAARNWSSRNKKINEHAQNRNAVHSETEYGGWR